MAKKVIKIDDSVDNIDDIIDDKNPRRRGRKPKDKVYSITKIDEIKTVETPDENIILHLPLTKEDIENIDINSIVGKSNIIEPMPYEEVSNYSELNYLENKNMSEMTNFEELSQVNDSDDKKLVKRNLKNIMFEFIDGNNRKEWVKNTNISCLWCCNQFDTIPCAIPEKMIKDKFYVSGCFCSFNCAAAYNFNEKTYNMWERYSLLNLLYQKMYNVPIMKIKIAPPRQVLKMFGGFMTIEEFRKNFLTNNIYKIVIPPMISLIPRVEENIYEHLNRPYKIDNADNENLKKIMSNIGESIDKDNMLKLKRDKPKDNTKMTLMSYMNIQMV